MQTYVDVPYMYTDFDGHSTSGFEDTATLKNGQIFLSDHGLKKEKCRVAAIKTNTNKAM